MDDPRTSGAPRAGRSAGRSDDEASLRRRLAAADEPYLEGASENPRLGGTELALLLRNRRCPPSVLGRIATERSSRQEVKRLIALHPRAPLAAARSLVPYLFWRDLSELSSAAHANPVLRRQAERQLCARLERMALGERVALARRASRGLIDALRATGETRVLVTLLDNPRTFEADAAAIARDVNTPPEALAELASHRTWGERREIRLALVNNPATPIAAALRATRGLDPADLRLLSNDATVPTIVRVASRRELEERAERLSVRASGSVIGRTRPGTV